MGLITILKISIYNNYISVVLITSKMYINPFLSVDVRCNKDINGSNIVPIAVGACLAVLVIIVLCIYIIGRLRNYCKKKSYETLS